MIDPGETIARTEQLSVARSSCKLCQPSRAVEEQHCPRLETNQRCKIRLIPIWERRERERESESESEGKKSCHNLELASKRYNNNRMGKETSERVLVAEGSLISKFCCTKGSELAESNLVQRSNEIKQNGSELAPKKNQEVKKEKMKKKMKSKTKSHARHKHMMVEEPQKRRRRRLKSTQMANGVISGNLYTKPSLSIENFILILSLLSLISNGLAQLSSIERAHLVAAAADRGGDFNPDHYFHLLPNRQTLASFAPKSRVARQVNALNSSNGLANLERTFHALAARNTNNQDDGNDLPDSPPANAPGSDSSDDPAANDTNNNDPDQMNNNNNNSGDSDNLTQIPFVDYGGANANKRAENNNEAQRRRIAASSSTRRPTNKRSSTNERIPETELLPFSEFNVQQPAFSDLIKSWPPTTLQAAGRSQREQSGAISSSSSSFASQESRRREQLASQQRHAAIQRTHQVQPDEAELRNHLNEDLDDTIVTADQSFERDQLPEPPTWVNYLRELGDYVYLTLRQFAADQQRAAAAPATNYGQQTAEADLQQTRTSLNLTTSTSLMGAIDDLLDDFYYDQYENSQVLYYGAQLVHEGDIFEIGCYMPHDQPAEWSKSGRPLGEYRASASGSPRVIRRGDFLGAKQNYSLKIFEASLSDSGNYRCNKMSRKYHKLVVVPLKVNTNQLYWIQQRLASIVKPQLVSAPLSASGYPPLVVHQQQQRIAPLRLPANNVNGQRMKRNEYLLPGQVIVENQPLSLVCNISDEFVLRKLRENPQFRLSWFKNGKQLKGSLASLQQQSLAYSSNDKSRAAKLNSARSSSSSANLPGAASMAPPMTGGSPSLAANRHSLAVQRVQLLQANGRQLYITSAQYSDAGDYLCSWSKLHTRHQVDSGNESGGGGSNSGNEFYPPAGLEEDGQQQQQQQLGQAQPSNLLAAGSLVQLMAPVKLRPFKSTYHVRQGNELRLICHLQRGYPAAHISWYVGNRLLDADFLRERPGEFRILQLQGQNQVIVTSAPPQPTGAAKGQSDDDLDERKIVEINPIPASRQQMQMTANGRGQWIEYREPKSEKYMIETGEQQLKYLQQKLVQLSAHGPGLGSGAATIITTTATTTNLAHLSGSGTNEQSLLNQATISMLVINSLDIERHSSRYACRATTRANTDEVTTVIRVQGE